jgi:nitrate/TMAO reductase-like tetraheme cytochrome c subunit
VKTVIKERRARFCLGAFVAICIVNIGFRALAAEIRWNDCVGCHVELAGGHEAPRVEIEILRNSIHSKLDCIDCHSDVQKKEHTVEGPPHQRYPQKVDCIQSCHVRGNTMGAPDFSPREIYENSVHGRAQKAGIEDSATCINCHGRHNIKPKDDPESTIYRANIPRTCAVCHEDMQAVIKHNIHAEKPFQEYEQSVHGKALFRDGLIEVAAICTDCHGVHDIQAAGSSDLKARRPETCGGCHVTIFASYIKSTHGFAFLEKQNPDAPSCPDCHGEHRISIPSEAKIPSICSQCHAEKGLMAKYNIPVDRASTYEKSYHGVANSYGSKTVANCASCHGYHDILPPTDPDSSVHPANLATTCGKAKCHPGITPDIASARIHVDVEQKSSGGAYYVRQTFLWILIGLLIVTFIWVIPDVARRFNIGSEE